MPPQLPPVASDELAAALLQAVITAALATLCIFLFQRHRKAYFAWFAAAWTLYLLRLGAIGSFLLSGKRPWLYVHQVITGLTALALLWAALVFSRQLAWRWRYLLVALFPPVWSVVAIYRLDSFLLAAAPMVTFLSLATLWSGWTFLDYHRRVRSSGARLLAGAFFLWGLHHLDYPFLRAQGAWTPWGYYLDILFELAVGAGILVLVLDDLRRGLSALSALSGDLQRGGDVLTALLERPLELPAVRGSAYFASDHEERGAWSVERGALAAATLHAPRSTLTCIRGGGSCAAWTGTHPEGELATLLDRVMRSGRPQVAPGVAGHASVAALPVLREGVATGAFVLAGDARDPFTALDETFLRALGQQVGAALHNAALYEQLGARTEELQRLSTRMVRQHEEERRRLSRELHDETAQVFTAVKMQLGVLRADLPERRERLDRVLSLIDTGIGSIRSVTNDLRPSLLDDLGLLPALRSLCADFQERSGVRTTLDAPATLPPLTEDAELALFRALQEGLSNVARHAGAASAHVTVAVNDGAAPEVRLTIRDDGGGLGAPADLTRWEREGHMGLVGMRERIAALGGTVTIGDAGRGAQLNVRVPLATRDG
ncbi:histidine kinase dimerization and phosphoacceptor region [Gemmatirosa kalamazoonensis]|uniref:histidine kinase n=1 Tax=Gemmatirosa kalamazoonensis TaxID=861299 RepID=W0REK2_9BACT|nr:GAF domain-containing sensor histidine kinase [Gemmatirosa kalamazoonensis]AHG87808.1 histidine kinase dimerization and phosphoacceptor region [Gemmatirosa kalamazoonensis]